MQVTASAVTSRATCSLKIARRTGTYLLACKGLHWKVRRPDGNRSRYARLKIEPLRQGATRAPTPEIGAHNVEP